MSNSYSDVEDMGDFLATHPTNIFTTRPVNILITHSMNSLDPMNIVATSWCYVDSLLIYHAVQAEALEMKTRPRLISGGGDGTGSFALHMVFKALQAATAHFPLRQDDG